MKTDLEIAREAKVKPIGEIAASIGIDDCDLYPYGKYIAKVPVEALKKYNKGKKKIFTRKSTI